MTEKISSGTRRRLEEHVPEFAVGPAARCAGRDESRPEHRCGALARWKVPGSWWFEDAYFCDACRPECAVALGDDRVIRRVRVSCDVLLSGVTMSAPTAQREAVDVLEAAVRAVGGVLQIGHVSSTVGRHRGHGAAGDAIDRPGHP